MLQKESNSRTQADMEWGLRCQSAIPDILKHSGCMFPQSAGLHVGCLQNYLYREITDLRPTTPTSILKVCWMGDLVRAKHSPNESSQNRQQYKENTQSIKRKLSWKGACKHVCQSAFSCLRGMKQVSTVQNTVNSVKSWYPELWDKIQQVLNLWKRIFFYNIAS